MRNSDFHRYFWRSILIDWLVLIVKDVYIFKEVPVVDLTRKGTPTICLEPMYSTIPTFTSICNFFLTMYSYHRGLLVCKESTIARRRPIPN
jgi:hypothetical protein